MHFLFPVNGDIRGHDTVDKREKSYVDSGRNAFYQEKAVERNGFSGGGDFLRGFNQGDADQPERPGQEGT